MQNNGCTFVWKSGKSSSLFILLVVQNIRLLSIVFNSCIFRVILLRFKLNKCNCLRLQCSAKWTKEHVPFDHFFPSLAGNLNESWEQNHHSSIKSNSASHLLQHYTSYSCLFHEWKFLKQSVVAVHANVYTLNRIFWQREINSQWESHNGHTFKILIKK